MVYHSPKNKIHIFFFIFLDEPCIASLWTIASRLCRKNRFFPRWRHYSLLQGGISQLSSVPAEADAEEGMAKVSGESLQPKHAGIQQRQKMRHVKHPTSFTPKIVMDGNGPLRSRRYALPSFSVKRNEVGWPWPMGVARVATKERSLVSTFSLVSFGLLPTRLSLLLSGCSIFHDWCVRCPLSIFRCTAGKRSLWIRVISSVIPQVVVVQSSGMCGVL